MTDEQLAEVQKALADPVFVIESYQKQLAKVTRNYEALAGTPDLLDMKEAAKVIKFLRPDGKMLGRNELFEFLRDRRLILADNSPSQEAVDRGWLVLILEKFTVEGIEKLYKKSMVTPMKGVEGIRGLLEAKYRGQE